MDTKKSGRRYDREFKENAVALVREGRSATEVARDLGVSTWSLVNAAEERAKREGDEGHRPPQPRDFCDPDTDQPKSKIAAYAGEGVIGEHRHRLCDGHGLQCRRW